MQESFKGLDGKVYILNELTYGDFKACCLAYQYKALKDLQENKHALPPDLYQEQLEFLRGFCASNPPSTKAMSEYLKTDDGVKQMIYFALRHNHPNLLFADLDRIIGAENREEVCSAILMLNSKKKEVETPPAEAPPTTTNPL